jgi:hypothetical protein
MEYFSPETLSIVFLLHESAQPPCEFDPNTPLACFIVNRILVNYKTKIKKKKQNIKIK